MTKRKSKTSHRSKESTWRRLTRGRALEITILVVFGLVVLYVASMSIKLAAGVSKTLPMPEHEVRLQILNGCGVTGLAARTADRLSGYSDREMLISVVDTDNFDLHPVEETFVIARYDDDDGARLLAERLGLDPDGVVFEPLESNYRQISVSLVLGHDWEKLSLMSDKEQ